MFTSLFEKIALVQCYIHHKKNVEINIQPPSNLRQLKLLDIAYKEAKNYFKTN